jgi:hypothetical protein
VLITYFSEEGFCSVVCVNWPNIIGQVTAISIVAAHVSKLAERFQVQ